MKNFINGVITARDIAEIKRAVRSESNNPKYQIAYQNVLADTQTAVDNIEECLVDVNALRKIYIGFSNGDISFLDAVLGLNPRGENDSHYRDYLTLDEGSIVGIRISGHPTTKKTLLDKANNNAQYLLQVVLVPQNPNPTAHDAITTDTKVGNLQVLTQVYVGADYNWDNLEDLLKKIADYLTCPEYSDAGGGKSQQQTTIKQQENSSMNSRIVTLTESRLRGMIHEAVKRFLYETEMNREYVDDEGNKISGRQALIQQGSYNYPKYNYNQAVLNQARFVRKVVRNYLKTVSHFYRGQRDFETSEVFNAAMNLFREMNFEDYRPPYDWNNQY